MTLTIITSDISLVWNIGADIGAEIRQKVRAKMGTIIYKPHCGKCGAIIKQEVTYRGVAEEIAKNYLYSGGFIEIEPYRCACCGEVFGTIEIPIPKENNGDDD